jgi:hypothetical protein
MEWVIWMAPGVRPVTGGDAGPQMMIDAAIGHMRRLRSCLCWHVGKKRRSADDRGPYF